MLRVIVIIVVLAGCGHAAGADHGGRGTVAHTVDGDTIVVRIGGRE